MERDTERIMDGEEPLPASSSENYEGNLPKNFTDWVTKNEARIANAKSLPYFLKDNEELIDSATASTTINATPTTTATASTTAGANSTATTTAVSKLMPDELKPKSDYLRGEDYTFSKDFFDLLDPNKPVTLEIKDEVTGCESSYDGSEVTLVTGGEVADSVWFRKSVVYHEYGHCIDAQRELWKSKDLVNLRKKLNEYLNEKNEKKTTYYVISKDADGNSYRERKSYVSPTRVEYIDYKLKTIYNRLLKFDDKLFESYGITKMDALEQIGATLDTIKSLNVKYGDGHSNNYFRKKRMKETELIAHSFENTFLGNRIFEKYLPEMYKDMVEYINGL